VRHDESLASLVSRLVSASYFEDAATAVLEAMFACVEGVIEAGPAALRGRLLRGVVHLRPDGSYQRLFGVERSTSARVEGTGYVTSGNVWTWIEEHRCSVSIDVQRASLRSWLPEGPIERHERPDAAGLPGDATRQRMLGRDATHVHVVPLRAPGGSIDGMITLEATWKAANGHEPVWEACYEELETLAGIAGAFIAARALPVRPSEQVCTDEFLPVVGRATAHLIELLRAFAPREDTILISGPTGAGKSRLARWCHEHSQRKGQPFEVLDVLGVPEDLQMAELFGWKKGAFTGATGDNPGAVARAAKGTLFLDEIDKLSLKAQAGLLRFIEERSYRMLGGAERPADVRLLVGTNADLRAAVRAGRFREDLYYRVNVLPVRLLPLAERLDELPLWAEYMLSRSHQRAGGEGVARLEPDAVRLLSSVPWPGNLRQLDNIVRRVHALVLAEPRSAGGDVVVQRRHVERALTFDSDAEPSVIAELLWRAARAFVREAERRRGDGAAVYRPGLAGPGALSLDLADAFRGMVLSAAVQETGGRDEAFVLLGQDALLKNRNHHRALRREFLRVRELLRVLGGEADRDLEAMLDEGDERAEAG
jgi:transcriptional regulator of acetoin/glycerol metabolism